MEVEADDRETPFFPPMFLNVRRNGLVKVFIIGYMIEKEREEETNFGRGKGRICKDFRNSLFKTGLKLLFRLFVNYQYKA